MKRKMFGRTGHEVSTIGFGAWALGSKVYGPVEENDAFDALQAYVDAGGNFVDTARAYGRSEGVIGRFMKSTGVRDGLFLCSKSGKHDPGEVRDQLEISLRDLQTDVIDLFYIHSPPIDAGKMNRLLDCYEVFREEGMIRFIGASIKGADVTDDTISLHHQYMDTGRIDAIQLIYSVFRQRNCEVFARAREEGVALVARTCLENGLLTGKYRSGTRFGREDHRHRWPQEKIDGIIEDVECLKTDAVTPPLTGLLHLAIRFALDADDVGVTIVGMKNRKQAEANLAAAELPAVPDAVRAMLAERYTGRESEFNIK